LTPGPDPLLVVRDLSVGYMVGATNIAALDQVEFDIDRGESLGIVGESGSGKSTLGLTLMSLLPRNASIRAGAVILKGLNLRNLQPEDLREIQGKEVAMIFQDPLTSLNPTLRIGTQMMDVLRAHGHGMHQTRRERIIRALEEVGIPDAANRIKRFPHEFSGGMRQRVMIAMALMLEPALIIADEPTSALDTTLQVQILALMKRLQTKHGTAILFISHDLAVVAGVCHRVLVMYAGRVVEEGDVSSVLERPLHPYTKALLASRPSVTRRNERLATIPGRVQLGLGCAFANRCLHAQSVCRRQAPRYVKVERNRVRCHIYDESSAYHVEGGSPLSDGFDV